MKTYYCTLLLLVCMVTGCHNQSTGHLQTTGRTDIPVVIFETDMGNDVDDALALDMVYKYREQGKIDLIGIMSNKNSIYSAGFIDLMATWYGHTDVPVGVMEGGPDSEHDAVNYAKAVYMLEKDGKPLFKHTLDNYESLPRAEILYRQLLAKQPDHSVTIISVGFSTNLIRLLDTQPDAYSPLTGRELVSKKVKLLSTMFGSFGENPIKEYNVVVDIPAAKKLMQEWPSPVIASPFEVGIMINYPAASIENDFTWATTHPVVEAYKAYLPMPYDRPTWDLTSVLLVAEPDTHGMDISEPGTISVDDKGYSHFTPAADGKHFYLKTSVRQAEQIRDHFVKIITAKPLHYK